MSQEENNGSFEYEFEIDYPYGTYDLEIMWDSPKGKPDEELELKGLPENELDFKVDF